MSFQVAEFTSCPYVHDLDDAIAKARADGDTTFLVIDGQMVAKIAPVTERDAEKVRDKLGGMAPPAQIPGQLAMDQPEPSGG